jgi:CO dehydrogenase/acetyl-CoA synthase beta subunit
MPKELKDYLGDRLKKRCEEDGFPELFDQIADETNATTTEELLEHLEKIGHPALAMDSLMEMMC